MPWKEVVQIVLTKQRTDPSQLTYYRRKCVVSSKKKVIWREDVYVEVIEGDLTGGKFHDQKYE